MTSRSGSGTGSGFSRIESTTVKIVTFAPMQIASVSSVVMAKARSFRRRRTANRMSWARRSMTRQYGLSGLAVHHPIIRHKNIRLVNFFAPVDIQQGVYLLLLDVNRRG